LSEENLLKKLDAKVNKLRETVLDMNERLQKIGSEIEKIEAIRKELKELSDLLTEEEEEEETEEW